MIIDNALAEFYISEAISKFNEDIETYKTTGIKSEFLKKVEEYYESECNSRLSDITCDA